MADSETSAKPSAASTHRARRLSQGRFNVQKPFYLQEGAQSLDFEDFQGHPLYSYADPVLRFL
jgi:hypothetical protein